MRCASCGRQAFRDGTWLAAEESPAAPCKSSSNEPCRPSPHVDMADRPRYNSGSSIPTRQNRPGDPGWWRHSPRPVGALEPAGLGGQTMKAKTNVKAGLSVNQAALALVQLLFAQQVAG
jgi:hypothetical protein